MVNFIAYDLAFMFLVTLAVFLFIKKRKTNLKKQGLMYLYYTKFGLRAINWTSKKFAPILKPLEYVSISLGYILMISILWLIGTTLYIYLKYPIMNTIKAPPVFPLVPYFPTIFKLEAFFPPFYFTYFIIALIIVAVSHEFSHGVFARLNNIRIKSTGFAFLGPILGAFVEQDEKQMNRAKLKAQLAVLSAGVFANIIMTLLFGLLLWIFFVSSFSPAGVYFNAYSQKILNTSEINSINNIPLSEFSISNLSTQSEFVEISSGNKSFFADPLVLKETLSKNYPYLIVFEDAPAFRTKLTGAILSIDNKSITSHDELREAILSYKPGENITIKTFDNDKEKTYQITLAEREGKAFLGVGVMPQTHSGIIGWFYNFVSSIKNPYIYYTSNLGAFGIFIYDLLWWIVIINFFVALFNMLPLGILDGGRFFYLTIAQGITKSEKIGRVAFKAITWAIGLIFLILMIKWFFSLF